MPVAKLLVVEDDPETGRELVTVLNERGYAAVLAATGHEAVREVERRTPDLVFLDLGLPDVDGVELCGQLRNRALRMAIVVLTARSREESVVSALDRGADDYMVKPFRLNELLARARAQLRRHPPGPAAELAVAEVGGLRVEPAARRVFAAGREVALRPREFDLLLALMSSPGEVVPRQRLMDQVWGADWFGDHKTLDVHVSALRRKVAGAAGIVAVRGRGYRLVG
ncbi:response regulator transcription factor [Actinomadura macrotermitis]|uniref:Alkaline phosphatase synthesis transcriptional regulatory protein PhoP n=1 Tax=Actinomadura macrotermitis TaxID=2585200 RepID=A0A7K0C3P7_9ACTN|nr:Alkaline phosphatase synthesis transcriptional regulatory protein PhoP [Actinomadura macrotermitis]